MIHRKHNDLRMMIFNDNLCGCVYEDDQDLLQS